MPVARNTAMNTPSSSAFWAANASSFDRGGSSVQANWPGWSSEKARYADPISIKA
jgi:hypothetical protein